MIPEQLLLELRCVKGFDEKAFVAAHDQAPVTSVRINPAKEIGLFTTDEKVAWCNAGSYLAERPVFTLDPAYHAGAYYVQEASSMFLYHLLGGIIKDKTGLRVLDLCAAPGGKSTLIASMLDRDSLLISNEVIRSRASILDENMTRWGYTNGWVTANDPRDFSQLTGYFDVIVVDAPCSGSGLFRKDKRVEDEWTPGNVQLCSDRQERILADIWPALKQDGILIYATCSYSPQEDEDMLDWLAATYDAATITTDVREEWGIVTVTTSSGMSGYRFFPDKVNGEGFFIAAVQKNEETGHAHIPRYKPLNDKKIQQQAGHLLKGTDMLFFRTGDEVFNAINPAHEADWQVLQKMVYFRKAGLRLGTPSQKEWLPAHDVALSIDAKEHLPGINVNKDEALRFLKREDLGIGELPKGWLMVRYQGLGLGWIKSLGNRANNYLPKHWRIRMELPE